MLSHGVRRSNDALEDIDLVSALVVNLILVVPQADGHQVLHRGVLLQDPPMYASEQIISHVGRCIVESCCELNTLNIFFLSLTQTFQKKVEYVTRFISCLKSRITKEMSLIYL